MYQILLVDDDFALRYVYRRMKIWEEMGFVIKDEASNGKEAYDLLQKNTYDVVITDIRMPVLDGIGLLKKMQEHRIMPYTILLSSYNEFEYARQALLLGASDFVVKPVKEETIREAMIRAKQNIEENSKQEQASTPMMTIAMAMTMAKIGWCMKNFGKINAPSEGLCCTE